MLYLPKNARDMQEVTVTKEQAHKFVMGLCSQCWAMDETHFKNMLTQINSMFASKEMVKESMPAWAKTDEDLYDGYGYDIEGTAAVIKIHGSLVKTFDIWDCFFGFTSMQMIQRDVQNALQDPKVESIFFDVDSPGGTVDGTKELSDFLYENRGQKPMIVYGNGSMMSGAYYIGSVGDEIYTSDTSYVGSIGVYRPHIDASKYYEEWGLKVTLIYAGKEKVTGNPYQELSEQDRKIMQAEVDDQYNIFMNTVARNRDVDVKMVSDKMAEGRVFIGKGAVENGLVDGLVSLNNVQRYVSSGNPEFLNVIDTFQPKTKGSKMAFGKKDALAELTVDALKEGAPEIHQNVFDAGKTAGAADAKTEHEAAVVAAAKAETDRATGIFELVADKPEMLGEAVELFKAGKTVGEAAQELLKKVNVQTKKQDQADGFDAGAAKVDPPAKDDDASDGTNETPAERWTNDKALQTAYQAKGGRVSYMQHMAAWGKDKKVQEEFGGDVDSYLAFQRNQK